MISLVIPVYNEQDSLVPLLGEIEATARRANLELEVIFVDDGSRDRSWPIIAELAAANPWVHGIRFRRNFGKAAALSAGFHAAHGDIILTLDADLQDDPAEIPRFLAAVDGGLDCVSGWKRRRLDPWHKVWPSRVFNALVSWLTGVRLHDHNCGMKCYRREVLGEVRLYGELHRFVPVLAHARGFRVGEIPIGHRPRRFGSSKYGVGPFEVEPIRVTHSITDATALTIRTRAGVVVHTGDFRFDPAPADGELTDEARLAELGDAGVRLLLSDSTNIDARSDHGSETEVGETLDPPGSPGATSIGLSVTGVNMFICGT